MLGCADTALGLAGTIGPGTGNPALGHTGTHGPGTRTRWDAQILHWDLLGSKALALGHAGMHKSCTGTHWDPRPRHWDILVPKPQAPRATGMLLLSPDTHWAQDWGHTGTRARAAGTHWDPHPQHGTRRALHRDHQHHRGRGHGGGSPAAPWGPSPFIRGPGLFAERAPPPPLPLPPDKPEGRDSVSGAVWRISRLFIGVWDTLDTLRTNLSHPPRSLPGTRSHSCAALSAP